MSYLNDLAARIHESESKRGWWDNPDRLAQFGEKISLVHSELSEALKEWRNRKPSAYLSLSDTKPDKPEGWGTEMADVLIRLLDMAAAYELDFDQLVADKMAYNDTRSFRHGGKRA